MSINYVPKVGEIYIEGVYIGYRDPNTGVFTGVNGNTLIADKQIIDGACVTIPAGFEVQIIDGEYQKINGVYQLIEIQ